MEFVYLLSSSDKTRFKIGKSSDYTLKRVDELARNWELDFFNSYIVATENSNGLEKTLHYLFQDYRLELPSVHNGFTEFFDIKCFDEVFNFCKGLENKFKTSKVKMYKISDYRKHSETDIDMIEKINCEYTDTLKEMVKFKSVEKVIQTKIQPMKFKIHHSLIEMTNKFDTNINTKLFNYILYKLYITQSNSTILKYRDFSYLFGCNTKDFESGKYDYMIKNIVNSFNGIKINTSILKDDINCFKDRIDLFSNIYIKKVTHTYEVGDEEKEIIKTEGVYLEVNNEIKKYLIDNNGIDFDYSYFDLLEDRTSINLYKLYTLLKEENRLNTLLPYKSILKILGIKNDSDLKELHKTFILPAVKNISEKMNINVSIKYYGDVRDLYVKIN